MPVPLPPRRSPGDVIRSSEWNQIIDYIEDLNARLTNIENTLGSLAGSCIVVFATAGFVVSAGQVAQVQPFSADRGASVGLVLPVGITFTKLYAYILSNDLDDEAKLIVRHNETDIIGQITVPPGETGRFYTAIPNYVVPEGERVDFLIDATTPSSGQIDVVSMSLYGVFTS